MKIEPGERVALDTNILLDATDESRELHAKAQSVFRDLPPQGVSLVLGTQVIREYLVVATRPQENNGLGQPIEDALANIREFRKRAALVGESIEACEQMERWAHQFHITGKKLHDLQLLATIRQAGIRILLTSNPGDFPPATDVRIATLAGLEIG